MLRHATILPGDPINSGSEVHEWSLEDFDDRDTPIGEPPPRDTAVDEQPAGARS